MQPKALYRRVNGPYAHGRRWRLVVVHADGHEEARSYDTRARAEAAQEVLQGSVTAGSRVTAGAALADYLDDGEKRWRASTAVSTRQRLTAALEACAGRPIGQLDSGDITAALEAGRRDRGWSVDTQIDALTKLRTFAAWAQAGKLVRADFTEGVKVLGRRRRGKPQLTRDEARVLLDLCLKRATFDAGAVAAALALTTGLRVSEITDRMVRDIDAGGTILIVWDGKTENAARRTRIPPALRPAVAVWMSGKAPGESLFGLNRHTARHRLRVLCEHAGVPIVTPHGLRGTNATLRVLIDETPAAIAAALGQGSYDGVTARHYVHPDVQPGAARAEAALLEPPPPGGGPATAA